MRRGQQVRRCGQQVRGAGGVVNRLRRNVGPAGSWRRGQQVRTWVNRCGERGQQVRTWVSRVRQPGAAKRGQPVRRNVVSRCDETWSAGAAKRGQQVRRNVESGGELRRGQPVRRNVVSRCGETWSTGAETRSVGAGNAVSRCGKRGQQVRGTRSTGAAKHCFRQCSQGFVNPARSSRSPRSFPERGEGREPVAACFAADAARRHRILLHTGLSHR